MKPAFLPEVVRLSPGWYTCRAGSGRRYDAYREDDGWFLEQDMEEPLKVFALDLAKASTTYAASGVVRHGPQHVVELEGRTVKVLRDWLQIS